ncbi:cysteine desulfurase family protein [Pseudoclavibacter endophyticus]|uniref:cysteine desulfurase n=1 Tax=Pseudoclavibacter endophyticus TaxID=1778590 RepID=A0A6H9WJV3_9MICO|nr:cysteine desulfurase family protein [Pseudoclavibacter endophyticus]KAB1647929.1 cysteine desulfurase [Pseudoclavibacter endophyticus]
MAVYLDHAATTPMRPSAREAYLEALGLVGNPASVHAHGQAARRLLEDAREDIAAALGCDPVEVVFTSGGTESINLAVKGLFWSANVDTSPTSPVGRAGILLTPAEHHATLDAVDWLVRRQGAEASWLEVDGDAVLRPETVAAAVDDAEVGAARPALLTTVLANNEVGAVQPIRAIAREARRAAVPVHVDAVAGFGHVPVSLREWGVDAVSVSAHKIGGPVGIGALAVARGATLEALHHGGGQQRALRSGTQDVAAAAAFAAAVRDAVADGEAERARVRVLRDRLVAGLLAAEVGATLRGPALDATLDDDGTGVPARIDANAHVTVEGVAGETLLFTLDMAGVSVSTGSACQAGVTEISHVVRSMGLDEPTARGAVRCTLGPMTTDADIDRFLAVLPAAVARARAAS